MFVSVKNNGPFFLLPIPLIIHFVPQIDPNLASESPFMLPPISFLSLSFLKQFFKLSRKQDTQGLSCTASFLAQKSFTSPKRIVFRNEDLG